MTKVWICLFLNRGSFHFSVHPWLGHYQMYGVGGHFFCWLSHLHVHPCPSWNSVHGQWSPRIILDLFTNCFLQLRDFFSLLWLSKSIFWFRWYFAMLSLSGVFAVTFSIVFAYVADVTSEEDRSTAYGAVGDAFCSDFNWYHNIQVLALGFSHFCCKFGY